jgi:malonate-semialdehyde dehydrogenase (acetylating)/methylmalonate-semialdehyde dehydrogenase
MDMTGDGGIEFFTNRIKVTSRWPVSAATTKEASDKGEGVTAVTAAAAVDHAEFSGRM